MVEAEDLAQLRLLNLELLRQLWVGQDAVRRSVTRAALEPRVTFSEESAVPERSWRLRPYLGYDWIAGSLDSRSSVASQPEAFFSKLQEFRETNKEECICSHPEPQVLGLHDSSGSGVEEDHECVYCYRVNRRLFPVPVDPGTPCRLCRTPRDQQGPGTLAQPAQVRVSIPLSILEPPHRYRIHRRKSFDASDTLALPRVSSTACWAGTFSLRSLRKAQPPRTWTSGPLSPLRSSTRSCQAPALFAWCHPLPRSGQCPRSLGPTSHGRSLEDRLLEDSIPAASSLSPPAGAPRRWKPLPAPLRPGCPRLGRWAGPGLSAAWVPERKDPGVEGEGFCGNFKIKLSALQLKSHVCWFHPAHALGAQKALWPLNLPSWHLQKEDIVTTGTGQCVCVTMRMAPSAHPQLWVVASTR
ncbi:migration and invasion-inhibitory protein isoform X3 [Chlorocebus sabaeus]|uniref:migration and invasion-inhibitory protein isoform X3 n=1 Tax=Chlorocebus sabaeus TaxID=60711 RepID=UPI003BF9B3A1